MRPYTKLCYIVYPPNYNNDGSYVKVETLKKAIKLAKKLGNLTCIFRDCEKIEYHNNKKFCRGYWTSCEFEYDDNILWKIRWLSKYNYSVKKVKIS